MKEDPESRIGILDRQVSCKLLRAPEEIRFEKDIIWCWNQKLLTWLPPTASGTILKGAQQV